MSTEKALKDVKALVSGLDKRNGTYRKTELMAATILTGVHIVASVIRGENPEIRLVTVPVHESCVCQQGSSQGKKRTQEPPTEEPKNPEGHGIAFVGPYSPEGGISLYQDQDKGFLRRFLGY